MYALEMQWNGMDGNRMELLRASSLDIDQRPPRHSKAVRHEQNAAGWSEETDAPNPGDPADCPSLETPARRLRRPAMVAELPLDHICTTKEYSR